METPTSKRKPQVDIKAFPQIGKSTSRSISSSSTSSESVAVGAPWLRLVTPLALLIQEARDAIVGEVGAQIGAAELAGGDEAPAIFRVRKRSVMSSSSSRSCSNSSLTYTQARTNLSEKGFLCTVERVYSSRYTLYTATSCAHLLFVEDNSKKHCFTSTRSNTFSNVSKVQNSFCSLNLYHHAKYIICRSIFTAFHNLIQSYPIQHIICNYM
jgi:hypothetical protein